jgi:RNA-binding protein
MIELTTTQRRDLRAAAHHLSPVVSVSQKGLAESVLKEIDRCLAVHELIKVKLHGIERDDRAALLDEICGQLACAPIQHIGNILVLWREKPEEVEAAAKPAPRAKRSAKPLTKKQAIAALERPRRKTTRT